MNESRIMKLTPVIKDYIWGGVKLKGLFGRDNGGDKISESWEVSVHADGESMTENGTLASYIEENRDSVGGDGKFPVLIKYIDAAQNLSVQVHPDDEYAQANEGDNGKTEMWYIISADDGAGIYCGFKRNTDKEEFLAKVKDGTVEELLNFIPVKSGDCFLIEAGTVHAIGAGCVICEIQQNSNVTYRVYDYNRVGADGKPRALHVDKAVDVINFKKFDDRTCSGEKVAFEGGSLQTLTACKYFACRKLELCGCYSETVQNSFLTVNFLSGEGEINGEKYKAGDSFFIPAGKEMKIMGNCDAIMTTRGDVKYYAGLDLGGTFVKCGIVDSCGRLLKKGSAPTSGSYADIAKTMAELAMSLASDCGVELSGVGIGAPGMINGKEGVIIYSNNLGWNNVPLSGDIAKITGVKVSLTNDANSAALGECAFGAGKQYENIIFVTLGTGVGGGIIIDGKIYEGLGGAGAELGHMGIVMNGEQCTCGRRGCLEAYASASALVRQGKAYMKEHSDTVMHELCGGDIEKLDGRIFFAAVRQGDKGAQAVYDQYLDYLACGLVDYANIFRPDAIILGGGISAEGELLTKPLTERLNRDIYGGNDYAPVKILTSDLANDAGLFGAAKLAMMNDN